MPLHTQREENIKEFDYKFEGMWLDGMHDYTNDTTYTKQETLDKIQDFISNIYIKIAEREMERLARQSEQYLQATEWDKVDAIDKEVKRWQEELNKLKA